MVEKTGVVGWMAPARIARRNCICCSLWPRSAVMAPSPRRMLRRPRFVFGGFSLRPALVSSTDLSTRSVSLPATIPQLGFVFHAAAVSGVLKTLVAAKI